MYNLTLGLTRDLLGADVSIQLIYNYIKNYIIIKYEKLLILSFYNNYTNYNNYWYNKLFNNIFK